MSVILCLRSYNIPLSSFLPMYADHGTIMYKPTVLAYIRYIEALGDVCSMESFIHQNRTGSVFRIYPKWYLRFNINLILCYPEENIIFSTEVSMDMMWLNGKPVLNIVDVEANFQNAIFVSRKPSLEILTDFMDSWTSVHTVIPDIMRLDRYFSLTSE